MSKARAQRLAAMLLMTLIIGCMAGGGAAQAEPDYAKWGRLAMQTVQDKFDADIVDYRYLGRSEERQGEAVESFRLWLKQSDREFGVLVRITVDTRTNEAKKVESRQLQ